MSQRYYDGDPAEHLVLESFLGEGTILSPLSKYKKDHMRICRPNGLSHNDAYEVIAYAIGRLGIDYDVRNIIDLGLVIITLVFYSKALSVFFIRA